jgi:hypothetical protein
MFRRTLAVVSLLSLGALVVPDVADARVPRPSASDVVVLGTSQSYQSALPTITRVNHDGVVVWTTTIAGAVGDVTFSYRSADRNVTEDAFYVYLSTNGQNLVNGKGQLRKYAANGRLAWAIGVDPNTTGEGLVSANPVKGGVYLSTPGGIYRINKNGRVVWGPLTFDLTTHNWSVTANAHDGGAFVSNYQDGKVWRITADGTVVWTADVTQPSMGMYSTSDDGLYIGSGSYSNTTVKLSSAGAVEWTLAGFPSSYTYARAVSPVDGSLFITSGWSAVIGHVAPDGTILNEVYMNGGWGPVANQGLAASLTGDTFYTGNSVDQLGVDAYVFGGYGTMTRSWHVDPGWYPQTGDVYAPYYRPYVGMPIIR